MAPLTIRWLKGAVRNLEQARAYIEADNPRAASRIATRIRESVANLSRHPEMGRAGRVPGTRELVVSGTPFIIPYQVRGRSVVVLRVLHAARKWPETF